jgi:hypothetical protein
MIALEQKDGEFGVVYENGMLKQEDQNISWVKHNLLCFGRADRNLTVNPTLRKGSLGEFLEGRKLYSNAWKYYLGQNITDDNLKGIKTEFNNACNRDFLLGYITKRISMISCVKTGKNSVLCKVQIGDNQIDLTI